MPSPAGGSPAKGRAAMRAARPAPPLAAHTGAREQGTDGTALSFHGARLGSPCVLLLPTFSPSPPPSPLLKFRGRKPKGRKVVLTKERRHPSRPPPKELPKTRVRLVHVGLAGLGDVSSPSGSLGGRTVPGWLVASGHLEPHVHRVPGGHLGPVGLSLVGGSPCTEEGQRWRLHLR